MILAPFGLAGSLTGQSFKQSDATMRVLDDWGQFYPLEKGGGATGDHTVVEVLVGGVKMRYPACYVLVTDMDDSLNSAALSSGVQPPNPGAKTNGTSKHFPAQTERFNFKLVSFLATPVTIQTPPPSPVQINSKVPQPGPFSVSVEHLSSMQRAPTVATILPERVWQECLLGGPPNNNNTLQGHETGGQWDFVDPLKRSNCTCAK